jgi:hypothetical protein
VSIRRNPCLSPDFCLQFPRLLGRIQRHEGVTEHGASAFRTACGQWSLAEDGDGDVAWLLQPQPGSDDDAIKAALSCGAQLPDGRWAYPASWDNLLRMKNLVQEADPGATIFPTAAGGLAKQSLGIGARFTALHWPAVDWAMAQLQLSLTANQNSIPRELVYDVDEMLDGNLDMIPFPFIGASIPEGHQGQVSRLCLCVVPLYVRRYAIVKRQLPQRQQLTVVLSCSVYHTMPRCAVPFGVVPAVRRGYVARLGARQA